MAIITTSQVRQVPGLSNSAAIPDAWVAALVESANAAVISYLKRNIELNSYDEYKDGNEQRDIYLKQYPVLTGSTTVASGSNGVALPATTINVVSTTGFSPGDTTKSPVIAVQNSTSPTTYSTITYTGVTDTSFTGCTGGTGTLTTGNKVLTPVVYVDSGGYAGFGNDPFPDTCIMVPGSQFMPLIRDTSVVNNGLLRRIGGSGSATSPLTGGWPERYQAGKLASSRLPVWPRGDKNLKISYSAGYKAGEIPTDIQYATVMLCAYMIRVQPHGALLNHESLGGYSYSTMLGSLDNPDLASITRILARYRETSW